MFLRRDLVNQNLRAAGIPNHIICRKRFPVDFGLNGSTETNIIFDESRDIPVPLKILGWQREAEINLEQFISDWKNANSEENL